MIKSMTGYGQGKNSVDGRDYTVEIKTINHRYNDMTVKLPRYLNFLEDKIRKYISNTINRGKTDVYITLRNMSDKGRNLKIDRSLAGMYVSELRSVAEEYGLKDDITATSIARMPDVFVAENESLEDLYWDELKVALDGALASIDAARIAEGERLSQDIQNRLTKIAEHVEVVSNSSEKLLEEYKTKLQNRIAELQAESVVDENRLGIEIVLFADKSSICEEVTRLRSHIDAFKSMLQSDGPTGKKIDFLIQEMNRETNTIGSKANAIGITECVIEMKNEIENIREQVQNIE
ncbi:MAG: YicC family protein [Clostridia bacterium]|nr:YicC family protein [Clostridia bacterium]